MFRIVVAVVVSFLVFAPAARADDDKRKKELKALAERLSGLPAEVSKRPNAEAVDAIFTQALNRAAKPEELQNTGGFLDKAKDRENALRDVLWAVVNSKEFMQVHDITLAEVSAISAAVTRPKAKEKK